MLDTHLAGTLSRRVGLGFGIVLAMIEVFYNLGDPSWWPFILVDYLAVALLVYGSLRNPHVLAAGWGFTCAMFYMAFFDSWEAGHSGPVFLGMGLLFGITIAGLALSLVAAWGAEGRGDAP